MLGVIAQQVEEISPGLVEIDDKDDMKTVKYSLLYMKAVKALQEATYELKRLKRNAPIWKPASQHWRRTNVKANR